MIHFDTYEKVANGEIYKTGFEHLTTESLRKFHNWIKLQLIFEAKRISSGDKLLDVAVGRGGDIFKWAKAKFKYVTGFDSDKKAIYEKRDFPGAIERYNSVKCDLNIPKCYFWNISATDSDVLAKVNGKDRACMYDTVSCQFSFNYFVKDIDIVLNFISKKLKPGGIFIGTATDGDLIEKNLEVKCIDKSALKIKRINEEMYDFELISEKSSRETYFEYRGASSEYFLYKDFLIEKCKEYDMHLVSILNFHEWIQKYYLNNLSKEEMMCSFLNFSFIFIKQPECVF